MKLSDARKLAVDAIAEHGLEGWRFEFDNAKRRFGACHTGLRKITMSRELVELNNPLVVYNTILHEIAHALTPLDRGHGRMWQVMAKSIGCDAKRTYDAADVELAARPFTGECPSCHRSIERFKRTRIACGRCCRLHNNNRFDAAYLFIWTRNN